MREITQAVKSQLNLPDLLTTDIKQYKDALHKVITYRNQSYYQIGQFLYPIQELHAESPEAFNEKFQFETFDDFLIAPIKDGGCGFADPKIGKRMVDAMLYGSYVRSLLPEKYHDFIFTMSYDALERIKAVENHFIKEENVAFDKKLDVLKEITHAALVLPSRDFRKNCQDIRNGKIQKMAPEPLSNNKVLAVAWGRLYAKVLDKQNEKGLSETQKTFWKSLLIDMQEILKGVK